MTVATRGGIVLAAVLVAAAAAMLLAATDPAAAQEAGWTIERFDVELVAGADGTVTVTEEIAVDFGALRRHGIFRNIPVRYEVPADAADELPDGAAADDLLRAIDLSAIEVSSPSAPDEVELTRPDPFGRRHEVTVRIGDPDRTVTGRHTYTIRYRVRGAFNSFDTHAELYWNATGTRWQVPIERATARVTGPGLQRATCFRGGAGSERTCDDLSVGTAVEAVAAGLPPRTGLTVVVAFEPDAIDVPPPELVRRWTLKRALVGHPAAWPLAAVVAVVAFGAVAGLAYREGRDRVTRGGATVDRGVESAGPRPLFRPRTTPVQYRPPDGLRPAQIGVLVDERVDPVDISATIVDLAVRGHLRIEETERTVLLLFSRSDWRLVRTGNPDDELRGYERRLLDGLFADGDQVDLSDLKGSFASDFAAVQRRIERDATRRGWFNGKPSQTRSRWLVAGLFAVGLGTAALVALIRFTTVAVAAVPLILAALLLAALHRHMPHRTVRGSRLLDRVLGFREFVVTAETGRMEFAEAEKLFVDYLPYAVVFGAVDRWADTFAELGIDPATVAGAWYVGHGGDLGRMSSGLSEFSAAAGTSLRTAPPSSGGSSGFGGGGFSGGGFGGGGGGSW